MTRKLLDVGPEVTTGAHPSLPNDQIPFWEDASNLIFYEEGVTAAPGHFLLFDKLDANAKLGLIEAEILQDTVRKKTLFSGTQAKLTRFVSGDTVETDVSRASGGAYGVGASLHQTANKLALLWSFAQWGEWVLATNGHDKLQLYRGNVVAPQKFADLLQTGGGALPFTYAQIIRRVKTHALALNTSNGADLIEFCANDDLFQWTETEFNSAGTLPLRNLNSQIMAAEDLGQAGLGVYGRDQMHLVEYIGAPLYIGERKLLDNIGAYGKAAVVSVGIYHYGWGPRGIWRTDGNQVDYIDNPSVRDYIKKNLNKDQSSKIVAWPLINYGGVVFFFPSGTSLWPDIGLFFSYQNNSWWRLDFGRTAGTAGTVFDLPFTADSIGNIFQVTDQVAATSGLAGPLTMVDTLERVTGFGFGGFGDMAFGGYLLETGE